MHLYYLPYCAHFYKNNIGKEIIIAELLSESSSALCNLLIARLRLRGVRFCIIFTLTECFDRTSFRFNPEKITAAKLAVRAAPNDGLTKNLNVHIKTSDVLCAPINIFFYFSSHKYTNWKHLSKKSNMKLWFVKERSFSRWVCTEPTKRDPAFCLCQK